MCGGDEEEIMSFPVSPSPTVMAKIAGNEVGCVLDTGAETSIIPSDFFHEKIKPVLGLLEHIFS